MVLKKTIYTLPMLRPSGMLRRSWFTKQFLTTGVPAMIGTKLVMNGTCRNNQVIYNLEELDPDPFMTLNEYGLPWVVVENHQMVD